MHLDSLLPDIRLVAARLVVFLIISFVYGAKSCMREKTCSRFKSPSTHSWKGARFSPRMNQCPCWHGMVKGTSKPSPPSGIDL